MLLYQSVLSMLLGTAGIIFALHPVAVARSKLQARHAETCTPSMNHALQSYLANDLTFDDRIGHALYNITGPPPLRNERSRYHSADDKFILACWDGEVAACQTVWHWDVLAFVTDCAASPPPSSMRLVVLCWHIHGVSMEVIYWAAWYVYRAAWAASWTDVPIWWIPALLGPVYTLSLRVAAEDLARAAQVV